jgi:hypothetical protein
MRTPSISPFGRADFTKKLRRSHCDREPIAENRTIGG